MKNIRNACRGSTASEGGMNVSHIKRYLSQRDIPVPAEAKRAELEDMLCETLEGVEGVEGEGVEIYQQGGALDTPVGVNNFMGLIWFNIEGEQPDPEEEEEAWLEILEDVKDVLTNTLDQYNLTVELMQIEEGTDNKLLADFSTYGQEQDVNRLGDDIVAGNVSLQVHTEQYQLTLRATDIAIL